MTLSFSTKWPAKMGDLAGKPNYFIEKIWNGFPCNELSFKDFDYYASRDEYFDRFHKYWDGEDEICFSPKIHTIRSGNRWKAGMKIHPVINNRTKDRFQFAPVMECKSVQEIEIIDANMLSMNHPDISYHSDVQVDFSGDVVSFFLRYTVKIDGKVLNSEEVSKLAINDGFPNADAFFFWFDKDFKGQIISWVDFKY